MQRAMAAVPNSRLGNGGAAHRVGGKSGFVDHGHHAAFDRAFFQLIGGYEETFSHNEDAEHDERARLAPGRIWMCAEATIDYFPHARLWPLARRYFQSGAGRACTVLKHRMRIRPRQVAAPALLVGRVGGLDLAPRDRARGDDSASELGRRTPFNRCRRGTGPIASISWVPSGRDDAAIMEERHALDRKRQIVERQEVAVFDLMTGIGRSVESAMASGLEPGS
jgi:hypothetical protein